MNEETEIELVYLGVEASFYSGAPKKYHAYIETEHVKHYLEHSPVYQAKLFKRQLVKVAVGAIIKCKATINGAAITIHGTPEFIGLVDFQTRLNLEARSEANKTLFDQEVERRKEENESALEQSLAPIKEAFSKMPNSRRRVFIAWLLVYLNA